MKNKIKFELLVFLVVTMALFLSGCATNKNNLGDEGGNLPQVSSYADDIKDINLPAELEWDRKSSMVIKTESFRGGVFVYRGRAEVMSLKDYMLASMQDNKWRLVGETASKDFLLAFVKPNKTCMIVISDGVMGKTEVKLYVAIDKTSSGGGNSFNENGSR